MQLRNMYNVTILLQGSTNMRLKDNIYKQLRSNISLQDFLFIYKDAIKDLGSALVINNKRFPTVYQKNFNILYEI